MGRTARLAFLKVRQSAQLQVVRNELARHGKQVGTDQATHLVIRGLAKLTNPTMLANLEQRSKLLAEANSDVAKQQAELDKCSPARGVDGFLYWLEFYGWTYEPRPPNKGMLPFIPFDYQVEAARWLFEVEGAQAEGIIEKARDMGATWLLVAWFTWSWLFEPEFTGLFCSRKVSLVDSKGDPSSIMHKARMMIRTLPSWMAPVGYDEAKHGLRLRILNPANGSLLVGEGGNQIGRGGRATRVLIDEAAFTAKPDSVEASLSETAEVKFWLSTPNNPGDWFATKRFSGNHPVLSLRWKQDPRKNTWLALDPEGNTIATGKGESPDPATIGARRIIYPWYEKAKQRFTDPAKMAREVDIDYSASSDRLVFPFAWVTAAINLDLGDMGEIVECGADLSGSGADVDVWTMRRGASVVLQKVIVRPVPAQVARAMLMVTSSVSARVLHYDAGGGYGGPLASEYHPEANGGKQWPFKLHAVNGSGKCSGRRFGDKPAKELFTNMRAELYWTVRERFRKAYELWLWRQGDPGGVPHDPTECISIPNDPELIGQLCSVLTIEVPSGKVQMESKKDMRDRGVKSPDKADSLVLSFAPTPHPAAMDSAHSVATSG